MRYVWMLALGLFGCGATPSVEPEDVLTLSVCPDDAGPCRQVANGRSTVTVGVCVPESVETRPLDLQATLRLPAGNRWTNPSDAANPTTLSLPLSSLRCGYPSFITSTTAGPMRIDAQIGTVVVSKYLELSPAVIDVVEIVPGAAMPAAGSEDTLTVSVRAVDNGIPSAGTKVSFEVSQVLPAGESAFVYPGSAILDASTNTASAKVTIGAKATLVKVTVTATPPDDASGDPVVSVKAEISLPVKVP